VFQNRLLTDQALRRLEAKGFEVLLPTQIPANDAGLGFGQLVEAAAMMKNRRGSKTMG
jgi:hydrogenase maturation protein HypF